MADNKEMRSAKSVYATICRMLDARNWKYEKKEEKLIITFGVSGDDIPMSFLIAVDADRQLVRLLSLLPFKFKEEDVTLGAAATSEINYVLADGSFDYNINDGSVLFRLTSSYRESLLSESVFQYMVDVAAFTVDEYNDKLYDLANGKMTFKDFIYAINK